VSEFEWQGIFLVTMVTKAAWVFHTQSFLYSEMHVGIYLKCLLLFTVDQNWNVLTNFSKIPQYQIS